MHDRVNDLVSARQWKREQENVARRGEARGFRISCCMKSAARTSSSHNGGANFWQSLPPSFLPRSTLFRLTGNFNAETPGSLHPHPPKTTEKKTIRKAAQPKKELKAPPIAVLSKFAHLSFCPTGTWLVCLSIFATGSGGGDRTGEECSSFFVSSFTHKNWLYHVRIRKRERVKKRANLKFSNGLD